jgi:hypothetical protein
VKPESKSQEKPKKLTQIPDLFNPYIFSFEILAATRAELASYAVEGNRLTLGAQVSEQSAGDVPVHWDHTFEEYQFQV